MPGEFGSRGSTYRVIGGDTSGIDEAIAELEQDGDTKAPGSDGGSVDN